MPKVKNNVTKDKEKIKYFILLHLLFAIFSCSGILSKMASTQQFFSVKFILLYGGVIILLFIYAIAWQIILKKLPLSVAFSNKAITVIWGMVWGMIFFDEKLRVGIIIGGIMIIAGIILVVNDNG